MDNRNTIVFKTSEVIANLQGVRHQRTTGTSVLKDIKKIAKLRVLPLYLLFSYCALKPGKKLSDVETDVVCHNLLYGSLNSVNKNEDMEVEVYPDSDVEDPDVKVCGICGDEGRKDLLIICSRCSDWAEHTYCMLKVPTKVPKGNWVCLECRVEEKSSNQRQDKIGRINGNVKKQLL